MLGPQNGGALSWARLPDGGPSFSSDQMVLQQPTPGYTNLLDCDGGLIEAQGAENGVASKKKPNSMWCSERISSGLESGAKVGMDSVTPL
ncbi:hypothetical protein N9I92_00355, partial [bacterium]|nr:hypothetical protein [bacterium]